MSITDRKPPKTIYRKILVLIDPPREGLQITENNNQYIDEMRGRTDLGRRLGTRDTTLLTKHPRRYHNQGKTGKPSPAKSYH